MTGNAKRQNVVLSTEPGVSIIEKAGILFAKITSRCLYVKFDTHSGPLPHLDFTVDDDRIGKAFNDIVPPLRAAVGILESDKVVG